MSDAIHAADAPAAAGPYSHAVRARSLVFLAGQGPFEPTTRAIADDIEEQVRQTLTNLATVAKAAGGSLANAVRVGIYLRDMDDFGAMNRVYTEFFSEPYPARTTIQSDMPIAIEIDAILELNA